MGTDQHDDSSRQPADRVPVKKKFSMNHNKLPGSLVDETHFNSPTARPLDREDFQLLQSLFHLNLSVVLLLVLEDELE